jgi:hypothetical protein
MTFPRILMRRAAPLSLLAALTLTGLVATAARAATPWGELASARLPVGIAAGQVNFAEPTAFTVDPTDGSYYVADQIASKAHPTFRIQRFNAKGEAEASVSFTPPEEKKTSTGTAGEALELAVDPARGRVYALVVYRRREADEKEQEERVKEEERLEKEGKKCGPGTCYERFPLDANSLAAGELYGFYYKGGQLLPAKTEEVSGMQVPAPIMTDAVLKSQGEKPKEALLNPHGVAVEPETGSLAITGNVDEQENLKVEKEEAQQKCRAAAQYITIQEKTAGELTGSFGHRYVDVKEAFEPLPCESASAEQEGALPFSPFVTAGGRLLAEGQERSTCIGLTSCNGAQVWELPKGTTKIGETAGIPEFETAAHILYVLPEQQQLVVVKPEGVVGPTMSFVPEGASAGKIYLTGEVENKLGSGEPANGAVLALDYSEAKGAPEIGELGWTAGGHEASGEACVIPRPGQQAFLVGGFQEGGAGGKSGVVAFDGFEHEKKSVVEALQFGPGGNTTGCPRVTVTPPTIKAKGATVEKVVPGEKVAFESAVEAANAASVEWRFENTTTKKTPEVVSGGYEYQAPKLERAFAEEGVYNVVEVVQSDDLASPSIEVEAASKLTVKITRPEFQISAPESIANGEEADFEAIVKDVNKANAPYEYVWKFGDGAEEPGKTSGAGNIVAAKHKYSSLCAPCTVTLEVTDQEHKLGTATFALTVNMNKTELEAIAAAAKKRQEEEAAATKKQEEEAAALKKRQEEEAAATKKRQEEEALKRKLEEEKAKPRPLTRAQLLARALKQCKKQPKQKRAKCVAQAHKKYGPQHARKKTKK